MKTDYKKLKTFCALPWLHISTRPNGLMRVCCTANASAAGPKNDKKWDSKVGVLKNEDGKAANLNDSDLLSAWNNTYMKNIRSQMLSDEIPTSCTKCFKEEKSGQQSKRIWETNYWSKRVNINELIEATQEDGTVKPKLSYIDLRLGSKCNLKCVMCSPHDSSMWVSDHNKLFNTVKNPKLKQHLIWDKKGTIDGGSYNWHHDNPKFWQQLYEQIPNLKQLYFAGGEPTIIKEHYELLEKCIELGFSSNIELRYNSNIIELPNKIFELWKKFKRVRFHVSVDAYGELNNYIRYPSKWETIEYHLDLLDQTEDHIEVTISAAVQLLNIYSLPDFIKWKLGKDYKKINPWPLAAGLINMHLVYLPAFLNIKVLPDALKKKVTNKYDDFYQWLQSEHRKDKDFIEHDYGIKKMKGIINFMNSESWAEERWPQAIEYLEKLDTIRGQNFRKQVPLLRDNINL